VVFVFPRVDCRRLGTELSGFDNPNGTVGDLKMPLRDSTLRPSKDSNSHQSGKAPHILGWRFHLTENMRPGTGSIHSCYLVGTVFLISLGTTAPAEDPDAVVQSHVQIEQERWDAFCLTQHCSEFPEGFATKDFAGERFYFPFDATMGRPQARGNVFPVAPVGPSSSAIRDFDEAHLMVRSYEESQVIYFHQRFSDLIEWYSGTVFKLPRTTGVNVFATLYPIAEFRTYEAIFGEFEKLPGLVENAGTPISASFVSISGVDYQNQQDTHFILSSGPLVQDQWVAGICTRLTDCDLVLWPTADADANATYFIAVENYRLGPLGLSPDCTANLQSEDRRCRETREGLEAIKALFEELERLLDALRLTPDQIVGNE